MRSIVQARWEEAEDRPCFGEYIFSLSDLRSKGQPVSHNAVLTEYGKCGRRAGFLDVGSHTPRKSKGRILFESGLPLEQISNLLGHPAQLLHCFTSGSRRRLRTRYRKNFPSGKSGDGKEAASIYQSIDARFF